MKEINSKYQDFIGLKFNFLTLQSVIRNNKGTIRIVCICDCGRTKEYLPTNVVNGAIKSCGCYGKMVASKKATKHGMSESRAYQSWEGMMDRCHNVKGVHYLLYGAKGITVCDEWKNPANFIRDMGDRPLGYSIDRIDNLKGYSKENCRWATKKTQSQNRKMTKYITFGDCKLCLAEWARFLSVKFDLLYRAYKKGMATELIRKSINNPEFIAGIKGEK